MTYRSSQHVRSNSVPAGQALRRVAVTGATGLLGSAVVAELLSRGIEVVAIVRNAPRARRLLGECAGLHLVVGDVLNARALEPALNGADAVIHTAAYFREYYQPGFDAALLERTNIAAVGELIGAAESAHVPVFVHISSAGTLRSTTPQQLADEDTPPGKSSTRNRYYASKVRAERLIESLRDTRSVRVPVVVPGWMWGPGDAGPTASGQMFLSVANAAMAAVRGSARTSSTRATSRWFVYGPPRSATTAATLSPADATSYPPCARRSPSCAAPRLLGRWRRG